MGLDMYLSRVDRKMIPYLDLNLQVIKENDLEKYKELSPYIKYQGNPGIFVWESLLEEVGYWRKANHIHNWFVENVQGGKDDCKSYEVSEEQLTRLLETCKKVVTACELIPGRVTNGYSYRNGVRTSIYEDGLVIKDASVARKLLPTCSGFFFGSTEYDVYYLRDIEYTIETVESVLEETDFDTYAVFYHSSW